MNSHKTSSGGMTPEQIKAELKDTQGVLAEAFECSSSHLSNVINGRSRSKAIATKIATYLNRELTEVFGDTYTDEIVLRGQERKNRITEIQNQIIIQK